MKHRLYCIFMIGLIALVAFIMPQVSVPFDQFGLNKELLEFGGRYILLIVFCHFYGRFVIYSESLKK